MYFAEGQVASLLAVCFIAVCFGTEQGMFPAWGWCCCPLYLWQLVEPRTPRGASPPVCLGISVQGAGVVLCHLPQPICSGSSPAVCHVHWGMSLVVFPSSCWSLAKCLSCWAPSCPVRWHISHSDFGVWVCVCASKFRLSLPGTMTWPSLNKIIIIIINFTSRAFLYLQILQSIIIYIQSYISFDICEYCSY